MLPYCLRNTILWGFFQTGWKRGGGWQRRRLAEEEQLRPGKRQDPGLCPDLLGALEPAAAPLWAKARQLLLCVLAEE